MEWEKKEEDGEYIEWTRSDDNAHVRLRRTAGGKWAVTLDRLRQAPEGEAYEHETFDERQAAERRADGWRAD
ncbi:MAG: hypothetical protein ACI8UR_001992 [Natronomonas sp.]|jgi:hypothetical protein|uniref:DUF7543 family protein n=1 Tax=Natronomonas sp. TaxID=2184060 RepID=UPI00398953A9